MADFVFDCSACMYLTNVTEYIVEHNRKSQLNRVKTRITALFFLLATGTDFLSFKTK